ncbi:MAG: hypothetical protein LBD67_00955 [Candidatus Accumulibacter sp.]|jgi:hypothetical protein|nr:hypothetical protein [Accumulibacter sp.]
MGISSRVNSTRDFFARFAKRLPFRKPHQQKKLQNHTITVTDGKRVSSILTTSGSLLLDAKYAPLGPIATMGFSSRASQRGIFCLAAVDT